LRRDPYELENLAGVAGYEHIEARYMEKVLTHLISMTRYTHEKEQRRVQRVRVGEATTLFAAREAKLGWGLLLQEPQSVVEGVVDDPVMTERSVLLAVDTCTVCGGDLKKFSPDDRTTSGVYPQVMKGHEYAGTVIEVGPEVEGISVGDRVAYVFSPYCGVCYACRSGHANFCQDPPARVSGKTGGFAEYVSFEVPVRGRGHFRIPDNLETDVAALSEPATCAIGAVLRANVQPGDIVVVLGLGGLGQMVAQAVTGAGGRTIGVDVHPGKVSLAGNWCEWTIDATQEEPLAMVRDVTGGIGADIVLEVVGRPETLEQSFQLVRLGGRVVIVGHHPLPVPAFQPEWIFRKDITVVPAKGPQPLLNARGIPLAFDYLLRGIIQARPLLQLFPLGKAQEAFMAQKSGGVPKAGICFRLSRQSDNGMIGV